MCFPEDDPPRSRRNGTGFDLDIARRLAAQLGRRLVIVWLPEEEQTDIESTDADYRPLLMGQCALQLSVPGPDAIRRYRRWLVLSEPYYGAGFELVPADAAAPFDAPFAGTVAVRSNTVAHRFLDAAGVAWSQQAGNVGIVDSVRSGAASAGLIWGPDLAALDIAPNPRFEAPPLLRWNLHAALRRDDPLREDVDRVLAAPAFQADVRQLLATHGIPVRGPFESIHTRESLRRL